MIETSFLDIIVRPLLREIWKRLDCLNPDNLEAWVALGSLWDRVHDSFRSYHGEMISKKNTTEVQVGFVHHLCRLWLGFFAVAYKLYTKLLE